MTAKRALLMVILEPPAPLEDEFNDWYDTEHMPQRRSMPGFESASRWVCLDGWPRWAALYDLASLEALQSPAYLAVSGPRSTPWSKRVLSRTIGRKRVIAVALEGNQSLQASTAQTSRLLLMGFPLEADTADTAVATGAAVADAVRATWRARADLIQLRGFIETTDEASMLWLMAAFDAPVAAAALAASLGRPAGRGATVFNLYAPYWRGGS